MDRCLETIYICIWRMFVFMSVVVTVWGSVRMFVVYRPLLKIVFFNLGMLKYVLCLCKGCDGCCVLCLNCDAWSGSWSYGKNKCFVMHILYVCVLCASCDSSQCCILHYFEML